MVFRGLVFRGRPGLTRRGLLGAYFRKLPRKRRR